MTRVLSFASHGRMAAVVAVAALLFAPSCGTAVRQGRGASYLVIDRLLAGSGGTTSATMSNVLQSDVLTKNTIFEDPGQVTMHIAMKDPTGVGPSDTNAITVNRYRVEYVRSDGANTQGTYVPYTFDGAVTGTITQSSASLGFVLVRAQAKAEAPLLALAVQDNIISTIARVTFYGRDQAGNEVSVTGMISVNFANWADPS